MKSSLAFDANRRVAEYRKSVVDVQENVLLFKGFLGPALRERPGMSSVGMRAARAAGVIVDSAGKLRCPPGTPNANQFTDLQMSNCLVPGAAAIKRSVRRGRYELEQALDAAKRVASSKAASRASKVAGLAALAALETLDYLHADGSGTLSATVLLGLDMARSVGRDFADIALDGLERRGKISSEQRKNLDKLVDNIAEVGSSKYVAALLSGRMGRRRWKSSDKQKPEPDVDGGRVDATELTPARRRELNLMQRGKELMSAKFSRRDVAEEHTAKRERLLDTYVPDKKKKDAEDYIDDLLKRMGVPTDPTKGSISKQIDKSLKAYEETIEQDIADLRNPDLASDADALQRRLAEAEILEAIAEAMKTRGGRKEVRRRMAENMVDALVGVEMSIQANPALRGTFMIAQPTTSYEIVENAAAWAAQVGFKIKDKRKIGLYISFHPRVLMMGKKPKSLTDEDVSELDSFTIDLPGEETIGTNLAGLAVHEVGHIEHYLEIARSYGIEIGEYSPDVLEQVKKQGPRLADSFLGMQLAMAHGLDPEKTWDSPEVMTLMDSGTKYETAEGSLGDALVRRIHQLSETNAGLVEGGALDDVLPTFTGGATREPRAMSILRVLADPKASRDDLLQLVHDPNRALGRDAMDRILDDVLDGQSVEEFIQEGSDAWASSLGFPPHLLLTRGVPIAEFKEVLHQISGYGNLNVHEAVAEGRRMQMWLTQYPNISSSVGVEELDQLLDRVVPRKPVTAMPKMTPELRAFKIRVDRILARLEATPGLQPLPPGEQRARVQF